MLAIAPPIPSRAVRPIPVVEAVRLGHARRPLPGLASSLAPALDLAFGLDRDGTLPEDIAACVAALHEGPLGHPAGLPMASLEASA